MRTINLTSVAVGGGQNDFASVYDVTGGSTTWTFSIADKQTFKVEVLAGAYTYDSVAYGTNLGGVLDGTLTLQESTDGENFETFASSSPITLNATTLQGGWKKDNANTPYIRVSFAVVGLTSGTLRILVTIKDK